MCELTILFFVLLTWAAGAWLGTTLEANVWNGGICKETGKKWKHFGNDSQGGRGYCSGKYTCWVSWPWVDRAKTEDQDD